MVPVLTVWEGDYGVDSVDTDSLILVTYVKLANIPCTIQYETNPLWYRIPSLVVNHDENGTKKIVGMSAIWTYLHDNVSNLNNSITDVQKHDCQTYHKYIIKSLLPAIRYTIWADNVNYLEVTRKWFRNAIPFPINYFYPSYQSGKVIKYLQVLVNDENIYEHSQVLMDEANKCIIDISKKLGTNEYFFGTVPSSFDAILFGYVAPLVNIPLPNTELQAFVKEQENLIKYVQHLSTTLFHRKKEYKYIDKPNADDEFNSSTPPKTVALAAFCAGAAMITYGIYNGIIKLPPFVDQIFHR